MKKAVPSIALISLALAGLVCCGPRPSPTARPVEPTPAATLVPSVSPTSTTTPSGPIGPQEMAAILATEEVPAFDPVDWLVRIGRMGEAVPRTVAGPPPDYALGSTADFFFFDEDLWETRTVHAELLYVTDHTYMWFEEGAEVDQSALIRAAERFEEEIYPICRDLFGQEWSPGVDNDAHISILHLTSGMGDAHGVFVSADEYTVEVVADSNQREMFYINLEQASVGSDDYLATLAHEFEHMIQWNNEGNESNWLDEGLAQLAERLTGFDVIKYDEDFFLQSLTQLNAWTDDPSDDGRYYGAAYFFALYLWERLGDEVIRALARHPGEGLASIDATLAEHGLDLTADDIFAEWIVANYLDDSSLAEGRYGYRTADLLPICPRQRYTALPVQEARAIPQYAAEYLEFEGPGQLSVDFQGATEVALIPTQARSGQSFWWSNRGDEADMTLTRAFDLSGLQRATLQFWMWYDLEDYVDLVHVEVSEDGGETWDILAGEHTVYDAEYDDGPNYTGVSGQGREPCWVMERVDLTPYAGQEILLRFEYSTDIYFCGGGFAVDDIAIPQLEYACDAESGDDGWEGAGFVRTSNVVPQNWALHLVTLGDQVAVQRLEVSADGTAHAEVTLDESKDKAVLVVGAMAPVTKEKARYEVQVTGELAAAPTPLPTEAGVLFQDDFDDPCGGWDTYSDEEVAQGYADGAYFLSVQVESLLWWAPAGQDLDDVVIEVDTIQDMPALDNSWGLICRYQDEGNFYLFDIGDDGYFAVGIWRDDEYVPLVDWTPTDAIRRGRGARNHLTVVCAGDLLSLTVNGELVAEAHDDTIARGDIGFSVSTFDRGGARILFDNLVVRRP